jgi:hypothetical protein
MEQSHWEADSRSAREYMVKDPLTMFMIIKEFAGKKYAQTVRCCEIPIMNGAEATLCNPSHFNAVGFVT